MIFKEFSFSWAAKTFELLGLAVKRAGLIQKHFNSVKGIFLTLEAANHIYNTPAGTKLRLMLLIIVNYHADRHKNILNLRNNVKNFMSPSTLSVRANNTFEQVSVGLNLTWYYTCQPRPARYDLFQGMCLRRTARCRAERHVGSQISNPSSVLQNTLRFTTLKKKTPKNITASL